MHLTICNPLGKESYSQVAWTLPLGRLPHSKSIDLCIINGQVVDRWQSFVPRNGDRVRVMYGAGFTPMMIAQIIASVISITASILLQVLLPGPKAPSLNSKRTESFGIAGFNNTTGPGTPEWVDYGVNKISGHVISSGIDVAADGRSMLGRVLYFAGDMGGDGCGGFEDFQINGVGIDQFEGMTVETRLGLDAQSFIPGFESVSQNYHVMTPLPYNTETSEGTWIPYTTKSNTVEKVKIVVVFQGGLYTVDSEDGSRNKTKTTIQYQYKLNSDPESAYVNAGNPVTYQERINADLYKVHEILFGSKNKWDVRMRITFKPASLSVVSAPSLFNVEEIEFETETYPGIALYAVKNVPAKQIQSLETMRVTCVKRGKNVKVPVGDGTYTMESTQERAWILRDVMTNKRIGMGHEIEEDEIPDEQWQEDAQDYWNELVDAQGGGTERRDECNVVINESRWDWEWAKGIAAEGRGRLFQAAGKWNLKVDRPLIGEPPTLFSAPGNIIDGSLSAEVAPEEKFFNQIIAEFRNQDDNYNPDITQPVTDPDIGIDPIVQDVRKYETITRESQAIRENTFVLKKSKLERRRWSFMSPDSALPSQPMDLCRLAERVLSDSGGYGGKLLENAPSLTQIILPDVVDLQPSSTYFFVLKHQSDNTIERREVTTPTGRVAIIDLLTGLNEIALAGDIFSLAIGTIQEIITRCQDWELDDEGRIKQLHTEYVPAVYTLDPLPSKLARRRFAIVQLPPIPLRDAQVIEEIVLARDGSFRSVISFSVTPGLHHHGGIVQGSTTTSVILSDEPTGENYFRGATIRILSAVGAILSEQKVISYVGAERRANVTTEWGFNPNGLFYEIEWEFFGDYQGFRLESADDPDDQHWAFELRQPGISIEIDGRGQKGTRYYRFVPYAVNGLDNETAPIIRAITLTGDLVAPVPPTAVALTSYFKTITVEIQQTRPTAQDLSGYEIEVWQNAITSGTLLDTVRVPVGQDNALTGTMLRIWTAELGVAYGTIITVRARAYDYSGNLSNWTNAGGTVTIQTVDTTDIRPNAVITITEFVNNDAINYEGDNDWLELAVIVITTEGGSIKLEGTCNAESTDVTTDFDRVEIRRGLLKTDPLLSFDELFEGTHIVLCTDSQNSGTYTYKLWYKGSGSTYEITRRRLMAFEVKR